MNQDVSCGHYADRMRKSKENLKSPLPYDGEKEMDQGMVYAKVAYEAYCAYTGGRSLVTGDKLPEWPELKVEICMAWRYTVKRVIAEMNNPVEYVEAW